MTHCTCRSRVRAGHQTVTGPVTPTRSRDRWGRAETQRTALGEALVIRRRTRVRFPPPPPTKGCWRNASPQVGEMPELLRKAVAPAFVRLPVAVGEVVPGLVEVEVAVPRPHRP